MFKILRTVALAMYTLLGTSFASGTISLGGLAGSAIPVVDPVNKAASALGGANKVSSAKTATVSNDASKALRGKSDSFLRFAQDEAYKTHIATVVKWSEKDSWLRDKKFDNSIWTYIPKVFDDVVTGQAKISTDIYDFAPKRSVDAYNGANWNALLMRNTVNYAFLSEQNAPELDALKTELEKQMLSDNILGGKYGKLIEFAGAQLGKTAKFNKDKYSKAIQAAVCDVKKYFRGCRLDRYIDELLKCHKENLVQFDRNSSKPQRCSFPNVQGYFCAGKDEKHDYLENFGYVEFKKPVDIGTKVEIVEKEWNAEIKKRYYHLGEPKKFKFYLKNKPYVVPCYVCDCMWIGRLFGADQRDAVCLFDARMNFRKCVPLRKDYLVLAETNVLWKLNCELDNVVSELKTDLEDYKKISDQTWVKQFCSDGYKLIRETEYFSGNGRLDEYLQKCKEYVEKIEFFDRWLKKVSEAEQIDLEKFLMQENIENDIVDKVYYPAGDCFDSDCRIDESIEECLNRVDIRYFSDKDKARAGIKRMLDNYAKLQKTRLEFEWSVWGGKFYIKSPCPEPPAEKLCIDARKINELTSNLKKEREWYYLRLDPYEMQKIFQRIKENIEKDFPSVKNVILDILGVSQKKKSNNKKNFKLPENFEKIMADGKIEEQMACLANTLDDNSKQLSASLHNIFRYGINPLLYKKIDRFFYEAFKK
ncbi:MAG: hypothetical protein IJT08_03230 [Alphaproteobacteria bacterium]|nr:hypothetical protein [Alphaproteobacteria bacterium]